MADDIRNIARQMDHQSDRMVLTYQEALQRLSEHASKTTGILVPTLRMRHGLAEFVNGKIALNELATRVDTLVETADDVLDLTCAIIDTTAPDKPELTLDEVSPIESMDYVNTAYKLIDAINGFDVNSADTLLNEAYKFNLLCHNIHRSIAIFETNVGGSCQLPITEEIPEDKAAGVFDRKLLEMAVTTGAIAIRPVALPLSHGDSRRHGVLPQKKKKYWYERYAIQR
jgi:hypothetical protein